MFNKSYVKRIENIYKTKTLIRNTIEAKLELLNRKSIKNKNKIMRLITQ
jgi:hypothetical protein